jgi:hypothetical protein
MSFLSLIFGLFPAAIAVSRTCSICLNSNSGDKNPNLLTSILFPYVQQQEPVGDRNLELN